MKLLLVFNFLYTVWASPRIITLDDLERDVGKPTITKYKADWNDLDTRPLPRWYDGAKIGISLHWGVYSVPSYHCEWFWADWKRGAEDIDKYMRKHYPPGFTYQDFAPRFTAEFFDPEEWASLFVKSGAKYIILTAKHHEGFTLFPSKRSFTWNSMDIGPRRDLVGELSNAVKKRNLKFGVYYSLYEWFNPMYNEDKKNNFKSRLYAVYKLWPDIKQLVNDYQPSVLWSDGDWEAKDTYWNSTGLLAWLYNDSPMKNEIVVNDRWGKGTSCRRGDFYNCANSYNPGILQKHKWESVFSLDPFSRAYRRQMHVKDIYSMDHIVKRIVTAVSCGGNVLMNVGPTKEGIIAPIFQERLLALGEWLEVNGDAIYDTSPWYYQKDACKTSKVWYTCTKTRYNAGDPTAVPNSQDKITAIYAIYLRWPSEGILRLKSISPYLKNGTRVELLGNRGHLPYKFKRDMVEIGLPCKSKARSKYAWALKFSTPPTKL